MTSNQIETFCPYCSQPTGRVRLNFEDTKKLDIKCRDCGRSFSLYPNPQNDKNNLGLGLDIKMSDLMRMSLHCPLEGKGKFKKANSTESTLQCSICNAKFTLVDTQRF